MTEDAERLLRQLADRLREQPAQDEPASDPLERLARALVPPEDDIDHDEVQAQLPTCAAAEARGVNVAQRFPQLTRHLHHCKECAALYVELLELEREPPAVARIPALDMSVIKRTRRQRVIDAAWEILEAILPTQLPRLQPVADAFFLRLDQLGDQFSLQQVPQMALAAGAGEGTLALRFLAATFVATQELDSQLTPENVETLVAEGRLSPVIHQVATSAAQQMKLGRHAGRFVAEYERWLMTQLPVPNGEQGS